MRSDGKELEIQILNLFEKLFEDVGYTVLKRRIQKAGTQDGFDDEFIIIDEFYRTYNIFIECKDYTSKLSYSEAVVKIPQIITSYSPDLMLFISPHKPFGNPFNDTRLEEFYNHFDVPIEFLTPDNGIEKIIALDENLYQSIYKQKVPFVVNKEKILENFRKFIFSTKPLKKVIVRDVDIEKYITDIDKLDCYISRNLYSPENSDNYRQRHLYFENSNLELNKLVIELTKSQPQKSKEHVTGLILLGNPGMGKSIELSELAIKYWENRDELKWIPFYRNVSNFTSTCELEDHLPDNWKNLPQILIILDGLDEVSFAQNFRTKLEKFILHNKTVNQNIKFVISCRTNIFENTIKSIKGFKCYMLDTIKFSESIMYLENKFGIQSGNYINQTFSQSQTEFFENPYFLNLFGEYYSENNILPSNKCDLFEKYVQKRLNDDDKRLKDTTYDKSLVLTSVKKVALILEAMQENEIKDTYLNTILGNDKRDFINSCFIQKVFNSDSWEFEHRSLQEFLVAKTISNFDFKDIIDFISVDAKTNTTHPSWFNSITSLINLIDKDSKVYSDLIDWLIINNYEVLLKADTDRITESIRITVFQKYFEKKCVKDTLWLSKHGVEAKELANFAYCIENIEFLVQQIRDKNNHRRTRISAMTVLSNMNLQHKIDVVKSLMVEMLLEPIESVDSRFKSDIIYSIKDLKLHKDEGFIEEIIMAVGNNDHHFVTSAIIQLIEESNPENFFPYLQSLEPKIIDDTKRNFTKNDNFCSSTEEDTFKRILQNFNSVKHLVYALETFIRFEYYNTFYETKDEIKGIIKKLIKLEAKDTTVYYQMIQIVIKNIEKNELSQGQEEILASFFHSTNKNDHAFKTILFVEIRSEKELDFAVKRHFLSRLVSVETMPFVMDKYTSGEISKKEILYFRNNLSYKDFELANKFQELIINKTNFNFNNDFLNDDLRKDWSDFHETKDIISFDLLFNKNSMLTKVVDYFDLLDVNEINWDNNLEDRKSYYNSLELQRKFPGTLMNLIHHSVLKYNGKANSDDVKKIINSELYLITKIYEKLKSDKNKSIKLTEVQTKYISDWCFNNIDKVTFYQYASKNDNNKTKCEQLWFFRNYLDLTYPENILQEMLFIDSNMYTNGKNIGYDYIISKVEKSKLNARIISNLRGEIINNLIFKNHAIYALENNMADVLPIIRNFVAQSDDNNWYYRKEVLGIYFDKTNDIDLLKELFEPHKSEQHSDDLSWIAIKMLLDKEQYGFVSVTLAKFYIENTIKKRELSIIKFLIISNYNLAFKILYNWIINNILEYKNEVNHMLSSSDWKSHNNTESIPYLIDLIMLSSSDEFNFKDISSPERIALDVLNNICQISDAETCEIISQKLLECKKEFKKNKIDLFYINTMLNDTRENFIKHKSKPMLFSEIANKIEGNKYLII